MAEGYRSPNNNASLTGAALAIAAHASPSGTSPPSGGSDGNPG
jgi:hypothetical protein